MVVPDCSAAFAPEWDALNAFFFGQQFLKDLLLKLKTFIHTWVVWEYEILLKMPLKRQEQEQV